MNQIRREWNSPAFNIGRWSIHLQFDRGTWGLGCELMCGTYTPQFTAMIGPLALFIWKKR